jgi:hypothetical protein
MADIVSAVFDNSQDAQRAVDWLRDTGVPTTAISVVAQNTTTGTTTTDSMAYDDLDDMDDEAEETGKRALTGLGVGAGVGALFGLAAAAIPGIGPFITAGALANVLGATGGMAVSGAIVGGTSGALASAFSRWGVTETESRYYAGEVERGGTWVGVDTMQSTVDRATIMDGLRRFGGRFATTS